MIEVLHCILEGLALGRNRAVGECCSRHACCMTRLLSAGQELYSGRQHCPAADSLVQLTPAQVHALVDDWVNLVQLSSARSATSNLY